MPESDYSIFGKLGTGQTPVDPLANALIKQSLAKGPMTSPWQLAGRLAQFTVGSLIDRDEREGTLTAWSEALNSGKKPDGSIDFDKVITTANANPRTRRHAAAMQARIADLQVRLGMKKQEAEAKAQAEAKAAVERETALHPMKMERARAGATRVQFSPITNLPGNPRPPTKLEEALDKEGAAAVTRALKTAEVSQKNLQALNILQRYIDSGAVKTGAGTESKVWLRRWLNTFGFDVKALGLPENAGPYEAFNALASKMALTSRADMPGQMSDADREFLIRTAPALSTTTDGNRMLIDINRKLNRRDIHYRDSMVQFVRKHGTLQPTGAPSFYEEYAKFSTANPLFGKPGAPPSAPATPPSAGTESLRDPAAPAAPPAASAIPAPPRAPDPKLPQGVTVTRRGTLPDGRRVFQGSDGTIYDAEGRRLQ